jgi:hypothetical protein
MSRLRSIAILLAAAALACGGPSTPVPVRGDIAALEGQWVGEYHSSESGRAGSIVFTLTAGSDTAQGDVIMVPADYRPRGPNIPGQDAMSGPRMPRSELLTVQFVVAERGVVQGQLNPYRDPECGCLLTTVFTGTLEGDRLGGTYRSWHEESDRVVQGVWQVERKPARSP